MIVTFTNLKEESKVTQYLCIRQGVPFKGSDFIETSKGIMSVTLPGIQETIFELKLHLTISKFEMSRVTHQNQTFGCCSNSSIYFSIKMDIFFVEVLKFISIQNQNYVSILE